MSSAPWSIDLYRTSFDGNGFPGKWVDARRARKEEKRYRYLHVPCSVRFSNCCGYQGAYSSSLVPYNAHPSLFTAVVYAATPAGLFPSPPPLPWSAALLPATTTPQQYLHLTLAHFTSPHLTTSATTSPAPNPVSAPQPFYPNAIFFTNSSFSDCRPRC